LGLALLGQNETAAAIDQLEEGRRHSPQDPRFCYQLAKAFARQNRLVDAVAYYQETLRIAPSYPEVLSELAGILSKEPEFKSRERRREPKDQVHSSLLNTDWSDSTKSPQVAGCQFRI